jgi:hypothetical protein
MRPNAFDPHWWYSHAKYGQWHKYDFAANGVHWWCGGLWLPARAWVSVGMLFKGDAMAKSAAKPKESDTFAQRLLARKKDTELSSQAAFDSELLESSPRVHELLVTVLREDKKVYEPASLLVFARGGSFHVCLSHKALDLKWWGEGPGLRAALAALEANVAKEEGQGSLNGPTANAGPS